MEKGALLGWNMRPIFSDFASIRKESWSCGGDKNRLRHRHCWLNHLSRKIALRKSNWLCEIETSRPSWPFFIGRFRLSSCRLLLTRQRQVNSNLFSFPFFVYFFNSFLSATRPSASRRRRNWNLVPGNQIAPLFADSFVVYSLESPRSAYEACERCKITLSIITLTLKPCVQNRYVIFCSY